jgi:feruloyl esterase
VNSVAASLHQGPANGTAVSSFLRLFMAPGMTHCSGGPGLNTFDTLTALERWVEEGIAPETLVASHTSLAFPDNVMTNNPPAADFSRPLCAYPKVAHYTGRGSKTQASSFVCAAAQSN